MNDSTSDTKILFTVPIRHIKKACANGIARRGLAVFLIQLIGIAAAFATQILLARLLGKEQYGVHVYVLSWMMILLLPAVFGMDTMVLRFYSSYVDSKKIAKVDGLVWFSRTTVFVTSLLSSLFAFGILFFLYFESRLTVNVAICFTIGLAALPLTAQMNLNTGFLRACRKPVFAAALVNPIRPVLVALFVFLAYVFMPKEMSARVSLAVYLLSTGIIVVIGARVLYLHRFEFHVHAANKEYEKKLWLGSALPLMLTSSFQMVMRQCDIIMIGYYLGLTQAGIYAVATRMVGLVAFGLNATNVVVAPMISVAYASHRTDDLKKSLRSSAATVLGLTIPLATILLLVGKWGLELFGEGFSSAYPALAILCGGQVVNALCGCVGYLLTMTGNERTTSWILFFTAILNIFLNAVLIPKWGMLGAAFATTTTMVVWNVWMMVVVWKRLQLNPTVLAWIFR